MKIRHPKYRALSGINIVQGEMKAIVPSSKLSHLLQLKNMFLLYSKEFK